MQKHCLHCHKDVFHSIDDLQPVYDEPMREIDGIPYEPENGKVIGHLVGWYCHWCNEIWLESVDEATLMDYLAAEGKLPSA